MKGVLIKHNPAFLSEADLVASFAVRHEDLAFVLDHISENTGPSNQHLVLLGPRGMGKTTLVLRVAAELRSSERFRETFFPIAFSEEIYEVMTVGEFWLAAVGHLAEATSDAEIAASFADLRGETDDTRLQTRALGRLLAFASERKKRLVLLVENLHMLLDEQLSEDAAWVLRKTLQTEPRILLVATATESFFGITRPEKAFFELLRSYRLEPLSTAECQTLWNAVTGEHASRSRIRPMEILTGGNPRLLSILASFARKMSLAELMGDLARLIDDHTTYFKANLEVLPPKERKVYVALADLWQPSTAREVAERARVGVNEASAQLARLAQRGAVSVSGEDRKKVYQVAERLYCIYHVLRRSGTNEARVRSVVDFMIACYPPTDLGTMFDTIASDACALPVEGRRGHLAALEALIRAGETQKHLAYLAHRAASELMLLPDVPDSLLKYLGKASDEAHEAKARWLGLPAVAVDAALDTPGLTTWARGVRGWSRDDIPDALVQPIAVLLVVKDGVELAESLLASCCAGEREPHDAVFWAARGAAAWALGHDVAAKYLRQAIALEPAVAEYHAALARCLYAGTDHGVEAEREARRAILLDSSAELGWFTLIMSLSVLDLTELENLQQEYSARNQSPLGASLHATWSYVFAMKSHDSDRLAEAVEQLERIAAAGGSPSRLFPSWPLFRWYLSVNDIAGVERTLPELLAPRISWEIDSLVFMEMCAGARHMLELAARWAPSALGPDTPTLVRVYPTCVLLALGEWSAAVPSLRGILTLEPEVLPAEKLRDLFVNAAAGGRAREALELLEASPAASHIEPVVVALRMHLGLPYRAPFEVVEMAKDVVTGIEQRIAALAPGSPPSAAPAAQPSRPARTRRKRPRRKSPPR